uniref:Ig-like domain-containing protein n=1 Tax=Bos indicus x Bos taurus TaxID=30522 RepID=A0A4W2CMI9_BOBOX
MAPTLPALLCLGLSVGLRTQVQAGTFPKPIIWAEPSSVVPLGSSVTILCQGPPNTKSFSLNKEGDSTPWNIHPSLEPWDKANFFISNVREQQAGRYHCSHFIGVNWSEPSEPLDLLVAGEEPAGRLRDRPSLSVRPGPTVAPGENVTLLCQSGERTDTFLLSKEGAAHRPLRLRSQDQDGRYQAEFSLSPVTSAHGGTYRCYGSLSTDPYLLSQPSEPLVLVVSGLTWYLSVLIGVSVIFVLLLLVLLFFFLHHRGQDRCRKSRAADPGPEDRGPQSSSSPGADAQDQAIYAAVSDAHSEVGLQLDHRVRPLLPSGHHRPPFAKLSSHPSCSHAHPTRPSRLPGSCCDPTLPLPCDPMARPSGRYVLWLTFWCRGAAPGFMRTRASVDGPHGPGPPLSPPSKGHGRAGATPQALQVRQVLSSW